VRADEKQLTAGRPAQLGLHVPSTYTRNALYCSLDELLVYTVWARGQHQRRAAGFVGVVEGCFMDRLVAVAVYSCQRHLFERSAAAAAAAAAVDNGDE